MIQLCVYMSVCLTAEVCIEKSLLLFRFTPRGVLSQVSESSKAEGVAGAGPLFRSVSISEADFQASPSPSSSQPLKAEAGPPTPSAATPTPVSSSHPSRVQSQGSSASDPGTSSSTSSGGTAGAAGAVAAAAAEPVSPMALQRRSLFSRERLRLLSFRSMEEPRMAPSVKERYPILKDILNFMKDQTVTVARYS